ncbi:AT-hook motif-containing protein, partial [Tanacetum coccineum]
TKREKTTRQYNAPTVSKVTTLIINDFGYGEPSRDIIVNKTNSGPQRISELHPSYMALQYPLLFPYGEDGFHEHIPYHRNTGEQKTKHGDVTMKEYYTYIIQQRNNQGNTLLKGGRLFQQYLVNAYTAIEEQRLKWTKNNQDTLRVDLYHNLCDAVTRGDTNSAGLGKRIVLPRSFTRNPRYMIQNYQDSMALCRTYGNPDLFITFTSNPKWPEIAEMLAYVPGQKSHDHPEIESVIDEDGYALYRRRNNKVTAKKGNFVYDNKHVIPYNRYLLLKYQAHINVEWCNRSKAIKYLFKYLNKGPDRATVVIQENVKGGHNGTSEQVLEVDEIKNFQNCRFIAPCEAVWRLFSYDIHYSYPTVMQLSYHLPDQNAITMRDSQNLSALLETEGINITMFTEWFELNKKYPEARDPASRERYYLRMLLNVVRGATSFKKLMTVNKKVYATFKAACFAYGLLNDDKEWTHAIAEASFWALGPQLRDLFVTILLFCEVSRPLQLWEENWIALSDDILHKKRKLYRYPELQLTEEQLRNYCLLEIQELLNRHGKSLREFQDLP